MKHAGFVLILTLAAAAAMFAQDIQVNRQNKTIAVTADESITADAEVAVLAIGYHNYAPTQDAAFQECVRVSDKITQALLAAGIPIANIETDKLRLRRTEPDDKWTAEMKKDRQFEAQQSWGITLPVSRAQAIVDLAVRSGANEVDDVEWSVADPLALQAKASGAALAKAHAIAEQMAKGLGAKLGELVYASNRAPLSKLFRNLQTMNSMVTVNAEREKKPQLTLFPQRVKSEATVYAVFAIE
jgi:uncharacterized protein YggE